MNGLEIVGLACVDATFRKQLFENVDVIINLNRADLTWAEEEGLRRITNRYRPQKPSAAAQSTQSNGPAPATGDPNPLPEDMAKVGEDIYMMCPTVPCPWPDSFTQNKQK